MAYKVERTEEEWRQRLEPPEYSALRGRATEFPWSGKYVENDDPGEYLCKGCDTAIFSSEAKFTAQCGWPAFSRPMREDMVERQVDRTQGMIRTEVSCATCGSHLGYLFQDGPEDLGGWRFCINSIALRLHAVAAEVDSEALARAFPQR
jgi:peptide-methionine (R)-S-oxide reductase